MRRLVVSADDYGLTPGVDRGIVAAVAAGSVTSVGVMAGLVEPGRLAELVAAGLRVSLGVHLNLTTGRPLSRPDEVPSLVDADGEFLPLGTLARRALARRIRRADVRRELAAQLARMRACGVAIDHLDSHEHVHLLPGVFGVVVELAQAAGVRRMRTHRPLVLGGGRAVYYRQHPRRVLTHAVKHALALRLRLARMGTPDAMVAPSLLVEPAAGGPLAEWAAVMAALPSGTWELVVHPAEVSERLDAEERARLGELVERRAAELRALVDPAFHDVARRHGVELVPFSAVPAPSARARVARTRERHAARA